MQFTAVERNKCEVRRAFGPLQVHALPRHLTQHVSLIHPWLRLAFVVTRRQVGLQVVVMTRHVDVRDRRNGVLLFNVEQVLVHLVRGARVEEQHDEQILNHVP